MEKAYDYGDTAHTHSNLALHRGVKVPSNLRRLGGGRAVLLSGGVLDIIRVQLNVKLSTIHCSPLASLPNPRKKAWGLRNQPYMESLIVRGGNTLWSQDQHPAENA